MRGASCAAITRVVDEVWFPSLPHLRQRLIGELGQRGSGARVTVAGDIRSARWHCVRDVRALSQDALGGVEAGTGLVARAGARHPVASALRSQVDGGLIVRALTRLAFA